MNNELHTFWGLVFHSMIHLYTYTDKMFLWNHTWLNYSDNNSSYQRFTLCYSITFDFYWQWLFHTIFNDVFNQKCYILVNCRMIMRNKLQRIYILWHCLVFSRDWDKAVMIASLIAKTWTWDLLNTTLEHNHSTFYLFTTNKLQNGVGLC